MTTVTTATEPRILERLTERWANVYLHNGRQLIQVILVKLNELICEDCAIPADKVAPIIIIPYTRLGNFTGGWRRVTAEPHDTHV